MYIYIVSNTYRIGKVRIEYVSYRLLTVSSQPYYITYAMLCYDYGLYKVLLGNAKLKIQSHSFTC